MKRFILFVTLLCLTSGCGGQADGPPPGMAVPVIIAKAETKRVTESVSVVGSIAADEMVEVQSEIDGIVDEIGFKEGQRINKDDLLFSIDKEKLTSLVAEAEANYDLAQANLKRSQALVENKTISSKEYDQALAEFGARKASLARVRQELADATIRAPFSGVVGSREVSAGQLVTKGQTLTSVQSVDLVKAEFAVPERYLANLVDGLLVEVQVDGYPNEVFKGEVFFVSPRVNRDTRTVLAKAKIENQDGKLRPGMLAKVNVVFSERAEAIVIPESAVMLQRDAVKVFVVGSEDLVSLRDVVVGVRLKGEVEIREGLSPGELVVAEGTQKLRPEAKVSYTLSEEQGKS